MAKKRTGRPGKKGKKTQPKKREPKKQQPKKLAKKVTERSAQIAQVVALAADATCLEMPAAVALVKGCLGGTLPGLGTKLGDIRPDPDARSQFCQCVADGAGVSRGQVPCSEGTTVGEVIDAIAC